MMCCSSVRCPAPPSSRGCTRGTDAVADRSDQFVAIVLTCLLLPDQSGAVLPDHSGAVPGTDTELRRTVVALHPTVVRSQPQSVRSVDGLVGARQRCRRVQPAEAAGTGREAGLR